MVNRLKVNLLYGSQVDIWFEDLAKTEKDTYKHLVDAFKLQWPLTKQLKASKMERVRALKEWTLNAEELGEKVEGPGGSKVYAHVRWANGLTAHVREAGDTGGFALGEVFNALPKPVKDLIRCEKRSTYKELADAVLAIDMGDIGDSTANHRRDEETARLTRAQPSPTKVVHDMPSTTHIQSPQHTYQPATSATTIAWPMLHSPTNLFTGTGSKGNLFRTTSQHCIQPYMGMNPDNLGLGWGVVIGRTPQPQSNALRNHPINEQHKDLMSFALTPQHPRATHQPPCPVHYVAHHQPNLQARRMLPVPTHTRNSTSRFNGVLELWTERSSAGRGTRHMPRGQSPRARVQLASNCELHCP